MKSGKNFLQNYVYWKNLNFDLIIFIKKDMETIMPIYMAHIGEEYLIKKVGGLEETKHHLKNLGFVPGAQVSVVAVMNGNLIVQVKDARVAISKELAGKIII